MLFLLSFLSIIIKCLLIFIVAAEPENNNRPIIGILSQETFIVDSYFPKNESYQSFIAASYVKYLESAGARVIPVWIGQSEEYYRRVINYTNGLFFPGGGTYFNETGGYGEAANKLYQIAMEYYDKKIYYPMWGTCLGMQVLAFGALRGQKDIRVTCDLVDKSIPLEFTKEAQRSRLFVDAPSEVFTALGTENVTYNQHRYCITRNVLKESGLADFWRILAVNKDINNREFISAFEHYDYPIYGVQFHPEKNQFEFKVSRQFPHTINSIKIGQYLANFFVNECRKNLNHFPNETLEANSLIYNYNPKYTGLKSRYYEQLYMFVKEDFAKAQLN